MCSESSRCKDSKQENSSKESGVKHALVVTISRDRSNG